MSVAKRELRNVLDAGVDSGGGQLINSSQMVAKSTSVVNYIYNIYNSLGFSTFAPLAAYTNYIQYFQSGNTNNIADPDNYPYRDGIDLDHTAGTAVWSLFTTNNGFKHYQHQMQSLKSLNVAGDNNTSDPSATSILGNIGGGNGILKTMNISLGEMRGFKYQTNYSDILPSSGFASEHLEYNGNFVPISVGSTA